MVATPLSKSDFDTKVKTGYAFIDFWAEWCGPCKMSGPVIDELSEEYKNKVFIGKVDVDAEPDLASHYNVLSIPTCILFKDGVEVARQVGFGGKSAYVQLLQKGGITP